MTWYTNKQLEIYHQHRNRSKVFFRLLIGCSSLFFVQNMYNLSLLSHFYCSSVAPLITPWPSLRTVKPQGNVTKQADKSYGGHQIILQPLKSCIWIGVLLIRFEYQLKWKIWTIDDSHIHPSSVSKGLGQAGPNGYLIPARYPTFLFIADLNIG